MVRILGLFVILAAFAVFVSNEFITDAKGEDEFMRKAAQSSMAEIALSNLALQKAQSEEVRRFAQMMIDDHTKANQELTTLAAGKNVTLPTAMDSKHQSAMNKLNGMTGTAFDTAYMKQMVKDHEDAVKLFQKQASETDDDAEVTAWASKTLPALQQHLQMARSISAGGGNTNTNNDGNTNSNMNMDSNTNMSVNMNSNANTNSNNRNNNGNTNRNTNTNTNTNTNMNTNSNTNTNSNVNSNMR